MLTTCNQMQSISKSREIYMFRFAILCLTLATLLATVGTATASSVSVKLSGPGAVDDTTIKAGEKVSFDIYVANDTVFTFFQLGFRIFSDDITSVIHPADSGNGKNERGDVKAYNGFENASIFDMGGLHVVDMISPTSWDGKLPDTIGFGGMCVHKKYEPHPLQKNISIDLIFEQPGTVTIDSSWFPPLGEWMFAPPEHNPEWGGPYTFKVVE